MRIPQSTPNYTYAKNNIQTAYNNTQNYSNYSTSFGSAPTSKAFAPVKNAYRKFMDPIEDGIAKGFAKLVQTKASKDLIAFTERHAAIKKNLFSHLIVLGSTLLSGFYVLKTLKNDKLDEQKRNTLAINQGAVFALSTVMAYTFDDMVTKKTTKIQDKFREINKTNKNIDNAKIEDCVKGIDAAKKIMIFTTMYRLIAPVIVTPLANYIGNKLQEKKEAEIVFGNKK